MSQHYTMLLWYNIIGFRDLFTPTSAIIIPDSHQFQHVKFIRESGPRRLYHSPLSSLSGSIMAVRDCIREQQCDIYFFLFCYFNLRY